MYCLLIQWYDFADKLQVPGAFGKRLFSSRIGADLERLKKSLEPTTPKESPPPTLNAKPCKRCIQTKIKCTREEPACWGCSRNSLDCQYPPPGQEFERSPSPPTSQRNGFPKNDFSLREESEDVGHSCVSICVTFLMCFHQAEDLEDEMDIDEDEGPTQRAPTKKRRHESDEENYKQSEDSDPPRKKRTSSRKTRVGGPVKLILRTSTPAKSKGKKVTRGSRSLSDLSSAPDSEDLQDPFSDDEDENEGPVRFPL